MTISRKLGLLLAAPSLLLVTACGESSGGSAGDEAAAPADRTLAELLADAAELTTVSSAMGETGLSGVLDATPQYTVLAPTDAAFAAFAPADGTAAVSEEDQRAALAATLRAHILPGYLTTADINRAIDAAQGGAVTVNTMADTTVTFSREGTGIKVTAADGTSAQIAGPELDGTNGVLLPVDTVLKAL